MDFTDGLRLYNGAIYTAGKTVNPWTTPSDGRGHATFTATGLSISGCTSGGSVASYRTEAALKLHGIPASTGGGGIDGQGFWYNSTDECIALRGGTCDTGARAPGALYLHLTSSSSGWNIGARAVLVP